MAVQRVVGLPLLAELIGEGIAAAVDTVEVTIALGTFHEVAVAVGSGRESTRRRSVGSGGGIAMFVHIVGGGGLLPSGDETLVVDGTYLVDAAQSSVGLHTTRIVVGVENPLEVAADAMLVDGRTAGQI